MPLADLKGWKKVGKSYGRHVFAGYKIKLLLNLLVRLNTRILTRDLTLLVR